VVEQLAWIVSGAIAEKKMRKAYATEDAATKDSSYIWLAARLYTRAGQIRALRHDGQNINRALTACAPPGSNAVNAPFPNCPVVIVVADNDHIVSSGRHGLAYHSCLMAAGEDRSRCILVRGGGHMLARTHPHLIADSIAFALQWSKESRVPDFSAIDSQAAIAHSDPLRGLIEFVGPPE
jgi:pimeloyl-ACP methyl ester carboxylesterase